MTERQSPPYELRVAGPAARQLDRLPAKVAAAIAEFTLGPLLDNPHRVGRELQRELAGLHAARRGAYRIVYQIEEPALLVVVLRIDHQSAVYRPR